MWDSNSLACFSKNVDDGLYVIKFELQIYINMKHTVRLSVCRIFQGPFVPFSFRSILERRFSGRYPSALRK